MQHKTLQATTTAVDSDLGEFEAIVATYDIDRHGEKIASAAFARTLSRWRASGKPLPLHWNHRATDPEDIVGSVDPHKTRETEDGLVVAGRVDLDTERGRQVWRALKSGSMGFSFGYLATESHNEGDTRVLDEIDLFEISIAPAPANPRTRILAMKALEDRGDVRPGCTPPTSREFASLADPLLPLGEAPADDELRLRALRLGIAVSQKRSGGRFR
jgi:HK97 family phage prohead protease